MLQEGTHTYPTVHGNLKYRFRQGRSDRQHLLVIFSGFRNKGTLDFGGTAINSIQHNILWIYDEFGDPAENSYYLLQNGTFAPRDAVHEFLGEVKAWFGLEYGDMAFAGFSKGGSAALYHGLTLGVGAIISTVPQFAIGSYVKNNWPKVFDRMRSGNDPEKELHEIDDILPEVLNGHRNSATHIYLISSPSDPQLESEINPFLNLLRKMRFFNFILIDSPLVSRHIDVTPYSVPDILALFQLCADKLYPYFGEVQQDLQSRQTVIENQKSQGEGVASLEKISVESDRIDFTLTTLVRGFQQVEWGDLERSFLLENSFGSSKIQIGKFMDPEISRRYLRDTFVDYRAAGSVSPGRKGYDISDFPLGEHSLCVNFKSAKDNLDINVPVTSARPMFSHLLKDGKLMIVSSDENGSIIKVSSLDDISESESGVFMIKSMGKSAGDTLNIQGIFAPVGTKVKEWGDIFYYLILEGDESFKFPLGLLDRPEEIRELGLPDSMRKSYFADLKGLGVDLSSTPSATYSLRILALNADICAKSKIFGEVEIFPGENPTFSINMLG